MSAPLKSMHLRNMPYARALRHLRYGLGLPAVEMAALIGCSRQQLGRWENGHIRPSRMAERAIRQMADEHGWGIDFDKGIALDPTYLATRAG